MTTAVPAPSGRSRRGVWRIAASLAAGVLIGALGVWSQTRAAPEPVVRLSLPIPEEHGVVGSLRRMIDIAPDGSQLVYSGPGGLWLRPFPSLRASLMPGTNGALDPTFSPDGKWIAYFAAAQVWRVPVEGGVPVALASARSPTGLSWNEGDLILYGQFDDGIWVVSGLGGGEPRQVAPSQHLERLRDPFLLPDGEWVVFSSYGTDAVGDRARLAAVSLKTGERDDLDLVGRGARYLPSGHLTYARDDALRAVPFDVDSRRATSGEVAIEEMIGAFGASGGSPQYSLSRNGTLVYISGTSTDNRVVWVDRRGRETGPISDRPIRNPRYLRVSPGGRQLVLVAGEGQAGNVFIHSLEDPTLPPTQLTTEFHNVSPVWSPDGQSVIVASNWYGIQNTIRLPVDGSATDPELIFPENERQAAWEYVRDGSELIYGVGWNVLAMAMRGPREARAISVLEFAEGIARLSPDNRLIAYRSVRNGAAEVFVARYPDGSGAKQVSLAGGDEPVFSPDGKELFYLEWPRGSLTRVIVGVQISTTPELRFGARREIVADVVRWTTNVWGTYDVNPDGRFVVIKPGQVLSPRILVVQHWLDDLKARVPGRSP